MRKRHFGRTLLLGAVGLLAAALLLLRTEWAGEQACMQARQRLPSLLGMEVGLGRCALDPVRGGVEVHGFSLTEPGAQVPTFAADRLLVRLRGIDLVRGKLKLERVEVDRPRVRLDTESFSGQGPGDGCAFEHLNLVEVHSLAINGGIVELRAPEDRRVQLEELDLDVRLTERTYSIRLSVPKGEAETGSGKVPLSRMKLASSLDLDEQKVGIQRFELAAGDLFLHVRGDIERVCAPAPSLEVSVYAPLDLASSLLGDEVPPMSGSAALTAKLEGQVEDLSVDGEVTLARAHIGDFDVGDAYVEARYEAGELHIGRVDLAAGEGTIQARGRLSLTRGLELTAEADLEDAEFAKILQKFGLEGAWVNFKGSGRVQVSGQLVPFHLAGPASITVRDFRVHDRAFDRPDRETLLQFDRAQVELATDFTPERARLGQGRITTSRSQVEADARLYFDEERGLDIEAKMGELDLADLGHIVGIPWGGRIVGEARLRGPYAELTIDGAVSGREFRFHKLSPGSVEALVSLEDTTLRFPSVLVQKGRSRFRAEGELNLGAKGGPTARATGAFENARFSDLVEAIGDEHWIFDFLRGRAEATISGEGRVEGPLTGPQARVTASLADTTYFGRQLGEGQLVFRAQDGEVVAIDQLDFDGPCGRVRFFGEVQLDQGIDFVIDAPLLHASELAKPDGESLHAGGTLAVKARLFGPPDQTRMEGTVDARKMVLYDVELGSGLLALSLSGTSLSLRGPIGDDLLLDGRLVVAEGLPFAVGVSAVTSRLGHYLPDIPGLKGSLSGDLLATGTIDRWPETQGDIRLTQLSFSKGDYQARSEGPVELAFEGSAIELRSLALKGPGGLNLAAAGMRHADGMLDVSVQGTLDAKLLAPFVEKWVEQPAGRLRLNVGVVGPTRKPTVVGTAEVEGGRLVVRGWPVSARNLNGRVEFSQSKVLLSGIDGTVNGGRARLVGEVGLEAFSPRRFDVGLLFDSVQLRYPEQVSSTLSGEVHVTGPPEMMVVSGEVDVVRLRYSQTIDLENVLRDLRRSHLEARSFHKQDEYLRYDLDVRVQPDTTIDNNLVKAALQGKLHVVGTNVYTGVLGSLSAVEGGRAFFRGNEFTLTRVSIDFTERDRIAPAIDIHAESQVQDYRVLAHAYGPAGDPQVDLSSEPSLDRAELVALLTLGFASGERELYSAGAGAGLVGETLFSISGLDKQVKRFIPQNQILRDFSFQIATQYSESSGMIEPTAQFESKFLTDSLKLRLSQPVISGKGRRAQAELRLNEHVSAQAQWDDESGKLSIGDIGVDLKLRWELE